MRLVIVHYHFRPGGIRRVIEVATPYIARAVAGGVTEIVLASGALPDRTWRKSFERSCGPTPVRFFLEPAFGYFSEQRGKPAALRRRIRQALAQLLGTADAAGTVVWAHNLGLARNLILTQELTNFCDGHDLPLLAHHHDWWFDNRWQRWPEARRSGFRSLESLANAVFGSPRTRHITINRADALVLQRRFGKQVAWLPNPAERTPPLPRERVRLARAWLQRTLRDAGPVWILPCRLLRRKNIAEALLLARWLRPEAWLVTTGGASSPDQVPYRRKLETAARRHRWRLRLGVLTGDEARKPKVPELIAASECVLLTSIQEGFGLPYLEAAAAHRPLIARSLPNIAPDLAEFGFRFPQYYGDIQVSTTLFDWKAERARQARLFRAWLRRLPHPLRKQVAKSVVLASRNQPGAVPFSRLTLTAQLEVLAQPLLQSWKICAPLNPFLKKWRSRAGRGQLQVTRWPRTAERWLSGRAYARKFLHVLRSQPLRGRNAHAAVNLQAEFIQQKLAAPNVYPLLWSPDT